MSLARRLSLVATTLWAATQCLCRCEGHVDHGGPLEGESKQRDRFSLLAFLCCVPHCCTHPGPHVGVVPDESPTPPWIYPTMYYDAKFRVRVSMYGSLLVLFVSVVLNSSHNKPEQRHQPGYNTNGIECSECQPWGYSEGLKRMSRSFKVYGCGCCASLMAEISTIQSTLAMRS